MVSVSSRHYLELCQMPWWASCPGQRTGGVHNPTVPLHQESAQGHDAQLKVLLGLNCVGWVCLQGYSLECTLGADPTADCTGCPVCWEEDGHHSASGM